MAEQVQHERGMRLAIAEAKKAVRLGEVPRGAGILRAGKVIGRGRNLKETLNDPTAHAEMVAIRQAAEHEGSWRILDATMYVTLEPCPMCAGAIVMARIPELVIGARDPRTGAAGSLMDITRDERLNHRVSVVTGCLEDECAFLLEDFFRKLRARP